MRRWLDSTASTIALTVVVAMILGFSLHQFVTSGLAYLGLAEQTVSLAENAQIFQLLPTRVNALLDLINRVSEPERQTVVKAARIPRFRIHLLNAALPGLQLLFDADSNLLRSRIEAAMTSPRPILVGHRLTSEEPEIATTSAHAARGLAMETTLSGGKWILFVTDIDIPPPSDPAAVHFWRISFAAWLVLSVLLGVVLSALAARRLVRPLGQLANAVEQTGGSGSLPPTQESGPTEIKAAIQSFNRMQKRLRKFNDDRTRMIGAMSHDLRTPLTRLRLRLEFVNDHLQQQKLIAELDRMSGLIESILLFSRDDSNVEQSTLVDLSVLAEGICEDATDVGQLVTFSGPSSIIVHCRPFALRRAISNIIDNAVKYGRSATVELTQIAEQAVIVIDDEGPGIPKNVREKVFEPFFRLDDSRNADIGGVGLGLSVARSTVLEHGGNITLGNSPRAGLSVRIELPATSQETNQAIASVPRDRPVEQR